MTTNPVPAPVVADPKRPWKAVVATAVPLLIALLTAIYNSFRDSGGVIPPWVALLVTAVVSGFGTYTVRNPHIANTGGV